MNDDYDDEYDDEYDDFDDYDDDFDDEYDDFDDEYDGGLFGSPARLAILAAGGLLVVALGWFVVRPALAGDDSNEDAFVTESTTGEATSSTTGSDEPSTTATAEGVADDPVSTDEPPETDPAEETAGTVAATDPSDEDERSGTSSTEAPTDSEPATATTEAPADTEPGAATTQAPAGNASGDVTYDTLPDGSPAPVVAVFGVDRITLTGAVPSQRAKERLEALALANARPGQGDTIADSVTINSDVPIGVGVRVVELTSARFPEASAEITPEHAAELDRVAAVMEALPRTTALVIGHANTSDNALRDYALSEQRAHAVVLYLASKGIDPARLSSRALGANDPLSLDDDEIATELNRRTEFVFYGLLVE